MEYLNYFPDKGTNNIALIRIVCVKPHRLIVEMDSPEMITTQVVPECESMYRALL